MGKRRLSPGKREKDKKVTVFHEPFCLLQRQAK
jgi:hypothetical protein